jgi:hypothetical protein
MERRRRSCLILLVVASQAVAAEMAPADVAKHFYELANQKKCDEASKLFTSDSLKVIEGTLGGQASFAEFCAGKGGKSALASLETRVEASEGGRVTVATTRTYVDGSMALDSDSLVKDGGSWRIALGENQNPGK